MSDRQRAARIRAAVSSRGARYASALVGLPLAAAVVVFVGETVALPNRIGVVHVVVAAAVFAPVIAALVVMRAQAERDVAAERAWLGALPFAAPSYFDLLAIASDTPAHALYVHVAFVHELGEAGREALLHLLEHDGGTWQVEDTGDRYTRRQYNDDAMEGRKLRNWAHALCERLAGFHASHAIVRLDLNRDS